MIDVDQTRTATVIGTRARPGGWVRLQGLQDGWIVSADHEASKRHWAIGGGLLVICSLPIAATVATLFPGVAGFLVIIAAVVIATAGRSIAGAVSATRNIRQLRSDSTRAGGIASLFGRTRDQLDNDRSSTADSAERAVRQLGSIDGVVKARKVRSAVVSRGFLRTDVRIVFADGSEVGYRVRGPRGPARLAAMMRTALGSKCTDEGTADAEG